MNTQSISTIMTKQVHHVAVDKPLRMARDMMDKYEIHHLPVTDEGKLVGMLSWNDVQKVAFLCDYIGEKLDESSIFKSLSIEELMTKDVHFLKSNASICLLLQIQTFHIYIFRNSRKKDNNIKKY